jgi:hypothetical protein
MIKINPIDGGIHPTTPYKIGIIFPKYFSPQYPHPLRLILILKSFITEKRFSQIHSNPTIPKTIHSSGVNTLHHILFWQIHNFDAKCL